MVPSNELSDNSKLSTGIENDIKSNLDDWLFERV